MKLFHVSVMSIDPDDNSEDPHQKYGNKVEANNEKEAKEKFLAEFNKKGLPVFWIKCSEIK